MENLPILPPPVEEEDFDLPLPTEETTFLDFVKTHAVQKAQKKQKNVRRERVARAYDDAFELIGGVPRLALWAHNDPKEFYKLHAKLIPSETKNQFDGTIRVIGFVQPTALDAMPEPGESRGDTIEGELE